MTPRSLIAALFGVTLAVAIVWAMGEKSIGESFSAMIRDPWGVVTLIDLYAGFVAFALVIWLFEKPWVAALLFVLLCVLGNIVSLGWLIVRGFKLIESRMERAQGP
jgi:hypothetical protein